MKRILIRSLNKSFGDKRVLHDFNAEIPLYGTTVIMGESGCGKTTLINILMGLEKADSGDIVSLPRRIAAVFQDDCLCEEFSAISNLRAVVGRKQRPEELVAYLEAMELGGDDIKRPVRELSGGMKRRVAIARALIAESDFIIMDEPFKGLDEELRKKIAKFVSKEAKSEKKQGRRGLLIITHDPEEIEIMSADHTIIMN